VNRWERERKESEDTGEEWRTLEELKFLMPSKHWLWEYTLCRYIA